VPPMRFIGLQSIVCRPFRGALVCRGVDLRGLLSVPVGD